jgi:hypothetical protein
LRGRTYGLAGAAALVSGGSWFLIHVFEAAPAPFEFCGSATRYGATRKVGRL